MDTALKTLLLVSLLVLGGCAGLGTFTGAAVREASRPEVVYAQPELAILLSFSLASSGVVVKPTWIDAGKVQGLKASSSGLSGGGQSWTFPEREYFIRQRADGEARSGFSQPITPLISCSDGTRHISVLR
jgi:hypothetical protein